MRRLFDGFGQKANAIFVVPLRLHVAQMFIDIQDVVDFVRRPR